MIKTDLTQRVFSLTLVKFNYSYRVNSLLLLLLVLLSYMLATMQLIRTSTLTSLFPISSSMKFSRERSPSASDVPVASTDKTWESYKNNLHRRRSGTIAPLVLGRYFALGTQFAYYQLKYLSARETVYNQLVVSKSDILRL